MTRLLLALTLALSLSGCAVTRCWTYCQLQQDCCDD